MSGARPKRRPESDAARHDEDPLRRLALLADLRPTRPAGAEMDPLRRLALLALMRGDTSPELRALAGLAAASKEQK